MRGDAAEVGHDGDGVLDDVGERDGVGHDRYEHVTGREHVVAAPRGDDPCPAARHAWTGADTGGEDGAHGTNTTLVASPESSSR